jgi:hypothetical protein
MKLMLDTGDYRRNGKIPGGSAPGTIKLKWLWRTKSFIERWAQEFIVAGNPHEFQHGKQPRWSTRLYMPLVKIFKEVYPEDYARHMAVCEDEEQLANKLMNRHHKMWYVREVGRRASTEHPENRHKPKEVEQIALGRADYMAWRARNPK